jgi:hypothetical protein
MADNAAWKLEDFVDSLVVELDKTGETLAVKAINKPLSYTVKEVALDLNTFPTYDGDRVSFVTARPGQEGSSKITIQLGSITDQQVRATAKAPTAAKGDLSIDQIPVDKATKDKLRRIGVTTVGDLKQVEQHHVDLKQVTGDDVDYTALANQIGKAQRDQTPPRISGVSLSMSEDGRCLVLTGKHLAVDGSFPPVAVVNDELARVQSATPDEVRVELGPEHELRRHNEVILTFDPFAVVRLNVRGGDGTA